jgi:signal transduction histidine kinase/ligand-binding sensor domain-containing protein
MLPPVIIVLMLLAGLRGAGAAAESSDYLIDLWTSDNDLPDSSVTAITQTPDGYLWIGTYNGLVRFDGVRFVTFDPLNTPELKHARIVGLFTDAHGTLWINTYDGSMTSLRNGRFTREWQGGQVSALFSRSNQVFLAALSGNIFSRTENAGPAGKWQMVSLAGKTMGNAFRQDAEGVLWYPQRDGKVGRIIGTNAVLLPDHCGLDGEKVNYLTTDHDGHVWAGTDKKIARWNGELFEDETPTNGEAVINTTLLLCLTGQDFWAFANGTVRHAINRRWTATMAAWGDLLQANAFYIGAYEEQNGGVWFREFGQGLFHAGATGKAERISATNGLPGNLVNCWFQDREGNIWVGLDRGGLVRLRKKQFQVLGATATLQNSAVATVCEDAHSNIWIGTFSGGLNRWHDGAMEHFELPADANRNSFVSACPDAQGRLWLSANREDLYVWETNRITRSTNAIHGIKVMLAGQHGRIWLGRQSQLTCLTDGHAVSYGARNGFVRHDVRALAEDRGGTLWIGTGNGVLYKFADGKFTAFKPDDGLENQAIWSLLPDDDGTIWVGTFRGGLLHFQDGKFTRYTTRNGLPSDVICQILDDGLGKLWIGSHKGIFSVPKARFGLLDRKAIPSLPCTAYGLYDGLPTLECSGNFQPSAWRARDGRLWFATANGTVAVNPDQVRPNRLPPPVVLEEFWVDGKNIPAAGPIEIPPRTHQLDFVFTALSFTAPDKVRFRYRLAGFDNAWVEAGTKRTAHYGPLPPGQYNFQVIACNNDGVWNEQGASLVLKQLPFFWQTWWFEMLAALSVIGTVSAAVRHTATRSLHRKLERLKQQRAMERDRERIARDIHDDLGAGLTQILLQSSLARHESPDRMRTDLTQISETARNLVRAMDETVWAVNPENDTLDGLVTYVGKFVQEFSAAAKLRCRLDLPLQPPPIAVSAETRHNLFLAIKESLNNIVKHSHATEVSFQLQLRPAAFTFVIQDNGIGFTPGVPNASAAGQERISAGHGLRNLARRLEEIGGNCALTSTPGQGTQVALTFPIHPPSRLGFEMIPPPPKPERLYEH